MYGLPLRVMAPELTSKEKKEIDRLKIKRNRLRKRLNTPDENQLKAIKNEITSINRRIDALRKKDQGASLDSEIALIRLGKYSLSKWIPNPFGGTSTNPHHLHRYVYSYRWHRR